MTMLLVVLCLGLKVNRSTYLIRRHSQYLQQYVVSYQYCCTTDYFYSIHALFCLNNAPNSAYKKAKVLQCHIGAQTLDLVHYEFSRIASLPFSQYQIILLYDEALGGVNILPRVVTGKWNSEKSNRRSLDRKSDKPTVTTPCHINNAQYSRYNIEYT